ncbi:MAG: hypothetical protein R2850_09310 [Bacteroidia bacterium]
MQRLRSWTSAGGTNPSLVEAMYLGCPVIAFGVKYNVILPRRIWLLIFVTKNH